MEEDLSIAIMNLISLEEHFYFTAEKTGQDGYFDLLNQTREIRKQLLAKMIDRHEGETWCITKHLLAATMRLKLISVADVRKVGDNQLNVHDKSNPDKPMTKEELISKLIDCCKE